MEWKQFKISLEAHKGEILVTDRKVTEVSDDECSYLLRGWNFSDASQRQEMIDFVETCTARGFVWALQQGHPDIVGRGANGESRRYLSFGRSYQPRPAWDVAVNNPGGQWYVIEARNEKPLLDYGIEFVRQSGGGHNLRIAREDLAKALDAIQESQENHHDKRKLRENKIENEIKENSEINETEKIQLIKARLGQGVFRRRVISKEPYCRLTGVSDPRFLRASHIKPWADSDNKERLESNNGLMLSPHVDHIFDGGYISFEQSGRVLFSKEIEKLLSEWSLPLVVIGNRFSDDQEIFLAWHRANCFRG